MARGFESKAVADQQESAFADAPESQTKQDDPARLSRLRRLQLARVDVEQHLRTAQAPAHREVLQRALVAIDEEIQQVS